MQSECELSLGSTIVSTPFRIESPFHEAYDAVRLIHGVPAGGSIYHLNLNIWVDEAAGSQEEFWGVLGGDERAK